jgi:hypothetical protein
MELFVSAMTLSSLTAVKSFGSSAAIDAFAVVASAVASSAFAMPRACVAAVVARTARLTTDRLTEAPKVAPGPLVVSRPADVRRRPKPLVPSGPRARAQR